MNFFILGGFIRVDIPGPKHFCDLSPKLPRHEDSDHLLSFKERVFHASHFCDLCRSCAASRKQFLRLHFRFSDFLIFWFLKRVQREGPKGGVCGPPRHPPVAMGSPLKLPNFLFLDLSDTCFLLSFLGIPCFLKRFSHPFPVISRVRKGWKTQFGFDCFPSLFFFSFVF